MRLIVIFIMTFGGPLSALGINHSYEGYDEIVDKLSRYNDGSVIRPKRYRKLHSKVHAGIGVSQTFFQSSSSDGDQNGLQHGGLMLSLGIDIFSPKWGIEGTFQNFGRSRGPTTQFQLKEYSIKTFYKPQLALDWFFRVGGGISSRFLRVNNFISGAAAEYKTPSMIITAGVDTYLTEMVSLGADFNFKNALINETIDSQSIDLSIRLDTHF